MMWARLSLAHLQYANTFFIGIFSFSFLFYVNVLRRQELIRKRERRNTIIFQTLTVATGLLSAYLGTRTRPAAPPPLLPASVKKKSVFEKRRSREGRRYRARDLEKG